MILSLLVSLFASQPSFALEPKNPVTLCDRFISAENQKICEERVKKLGPDWYLASVCENIFEDAKFFACLEMTKISNFNPKSLEKCGSAELGDDQKIACLQSVALKDTQPTGRLPASAKKKIPARR